MSLTGKQNLGQKEKKILKRRKKKKSEITARQQFHKFGKMVSCQFVFINCYIGNEAQSIEKMVGEQDQVNRFAKPPQKSLNWSIEESGFLPENQ